MLVSISGLDSLVGLRLTDETRSQQVSQMRATAQNQRAVEAFQDRIGLVNTPKELTDDFEVYSFVMRAFDLEAQVFGKGLVRKLLESDAEDPSSLVNRLTDRRFRVLHDALGFARAGPERPDFNSASWQASIINRYFDQAFESSAADQNPTVGTVLKLRREAPSITNWFQILRDKELSEFFRTSLGLPDQMAAIDVDKQKSLFAKSFDLKTLTDPKVLDRIISRYIAISDIKSPPAGASSPAISLLRGSSELGVIISLNVPQVSFSASTLFR